jgi:cyclase
LDQANPFAIARAPITLSAMPSSELHPRALAVRPYDRGLHDLGNGTFAYLQPNGSWGWSNAGLIVDGKDALLVDTLFDLHLTRDMLDAMRRADPRAANIGTVVNTHANPDHTHGNSLLPQAEIIASVDAAEEMAHEDPARLAMMMRAMRQGSDIASRYMVDILGSFDFEGIPKSVPTRTFREQLDLHIGAKKVSLLDCGSSHTGGDIIIHVPQDRIAYSGDLLFIGGHPIMWSGPIDNWIRACDRLLGLEVDLIVPGHGPITDHRGVRAVRDYLVLIRDRAAAAHAGGIAVMEAAHEIAKALDNAGYNEWCDGERVVATITAIYKHLDHDASPPNVPAVFSAMAQFKASRAQPL